MAQRLLHDRPLRQQVGLCGLRAHGRQADHFPRTGRDERRPDGGDDGARRGKSRRRIETAGRLQVTEVGTMLGACLAGVGIARIKAIGIRDLLEQGLLVELLPEWRGEAFPLHALYPSHHLPAAKVRAFIDFVVEVIEGRRV